MDIRREIALFVGLGIVFSIIATFPLFQHSSYFSNHGDINRALIFSGAARESVLSGQLPLWNPYTCGGGPLLADLESWFLQPFFWITLPFNELFAIKISYTLTLFTAFLGFTFFARKVLHFQVLGSLTVGVIMAFGGYISQHLAEGYYVWVSSAWIPWFLLMGIMSIKNIRYIPLAGLFLAFMFGSGSMHMVVYCLLFLALVFLFIRDDSMGRRIAILAGIVLFFALFASIKLLPAMGLFAAQQSRPGFTLPLQFLPQMLLSRGLVPAISYNGTLYRWGEFGNYVGYIALLLSCIPLVYRRFEVWKKYRGFLIASIIMLALSFISIPVMHGYVSYLTDLFRIPSRLMLFPMLGLAILAGSGIDMISLSSRARRKDSDKRDVDSGSRAGMTLLSVFIFLLLVADLVSNDSILFSRMLQLPLPEIHVESTFMRVREAYSTKDETYYRAGYIDFLEKRGTNGLCRFYQTKPHTAAINNTSKQKESRGEAYVDDKDSGKAEILSRDNNSVLIHATLSGPSAVIVNMNYYPGWRTDTEFPVYNEGGLIAITVPQGEYYFTLRYQPKEVYFGIALTTIGMFLGAAWFFRR